MTPALLATLVVFPAVMAYAAASDLFSMTISNRVCLILVAAFAVTAGWLGLPWSVIGLHAAAGVAVLFVCFGLFAAGWIGGGDAKLAAATALWFGFEQLLPYLQIATIAGGLLTALILWLRRAPLPGVAAGWPWARRLHSATEGVPYGVALSLSALLVLPHTAVWRASIGL
jgi:prepilin peptidase CpaA